MFFEQEKLNAVGKKSSSLFEWRGQFTPEFIDYLLDTYGFDGMTVADPFCGSGTVLIESAKRGYKAFGCDINPAAYMMSKFLEYAGWSYHGIKELVYKQGKEFFDVFVFGSGVLKDDDMNTEENRMKIVDAMKTSTYMEGPRLYVPFILAVLFKLEKTRKKKPIRELIEEISYDLMKYLLGTGGECILYAQCKDARCIGKDLKQSVDLIITSPPYINVFNYHQNYRKLMERVGYDILPIAEGEFGSNRKHRENRFKTVVQYTIDMGKAIESMAESLKYGGRIVLVVGRESTVNGVPFCNSRIVWKCLAANPGVKIEDAAVREFKNRFGETIVEDIIIARRVHPVKIFTEDFYKKIAEDELKLAIESTEDPDIIHMMKDVIINIYKIKSSKIISHDKN